MLKAIFHSISRRQKGIFATKLKPSPKKKLAREEKSVIKKARRKQQKSNFGLWSLAWAEWQHWYFASFSLGVGSTTTEPGQTWPWGSLHECSISVS